MKQLIMLINDIELPANNDCDTVVISKNSLMVVVLITAVMVFIMFLSLIVMLVKNGRKSTSPVYQRYEIMDDFQGISQRYERIGDFSRVSLTHEMTGNKMDKNARKRSNSEQEENTVCVQRKDKYEDENTVCIWNDKARKSISLTDRNKIEKVFSCGFSENISIGRGINNNIVIDYDKSISGRHCVISYRNGRYFIKDNGSANHTFVNGSKVTGEAQIFSGNIIKLGRVELIVTIR